MAKKIEKHLTQEGVKIVGLYYASILSEPERITDESEDQFIERYTEWQNIIETVCRYREKWEEKFSYTIPRRPPSPRQRPPRKRA